jgi:hypothetical protein
MTDKVFDDSSCCGHYHSDDSSDNIGNNYDGDDQL